MNCVAGKIVVIARSETQRASGLAVSRNYASLGFPATRMGARQALPSSKVGEFYCINRQQQVEVGRYNIGSKGHNGTEGGSYKEANWQLKHFYEPTMTW